MAIEIVQGEKSLVDLESALNDHDYVVEDRCVLKRGLPKPRFSVGSVKAVPLAWLIVKGEIVTEVQVYDDEVYLLTEEGYDRKDGEPIVHSTYELFGKEIKKIYEK